MQLCMWSVVFLWGHFISWSFWERGSFSHQVLQQLLAQRCSSKHPERTVAWIAPHRPLKCFSFSITCNSIVSHVHNWHLHMNVSRHSPHVWCNMQHKLCTAHERREVMWRLLAADHFICHNVTVASDIFFFTPMWYERRCGVHCVHYGLLQLWGCDPWSGLEMCRPKCIPFIALSFFFLYFCRFKVCVQRLLRHHNIVIFFFFFCLRVERELESRKEILKFVTRVAFYRTVSLNCLKVYIKS